MKLSDIVVRLASQLPKHTNKFHNAVAYTSVSVDANGLVTVTTPKPHGLETGNFVTLTDIKIKRRILEYKHEIPGKAFIEVDSDHDLTENWQKTVKISGAVEEYFNGDLPLLEVPNRRFFYVKVPNDANNYATGLDMYYHERLEISLDGAYQVTKVSDTVFTFNVGSDTGIDFSNFDGVIAQYLRVMGTASIERFKDLYTKNGANEYWAVVMMDDASNSKDRNNTTDAISSSGVSGDFRSILLEPFSVYIFAPTKSQLSGVETVDIMHSEIASALYKSLYGWKPPTGFSSETENGIQPVAHGTVEYNNAYYVHQFRFETNKELTLDDSAAYSGGSISPTRAFRDVVLNFANEFETTVLSRAVNLDDDPLPPNLD